MERNYADQTGTVVLDEKPGARLPMENGTIAIRDDGDDARAPEYLPSQG